MAHMGQCLPPLIKALLQPARYPDAPPRVELVETHISWVLLAGDFAYKIKKPLRLPFLDFGTLELRKARCDDELRLNRRFAPDIYIGVVGIFNTPEAPGFVAQGEPIEYAVKMRRFDASQRLDQVCSRGELNPAYLSAFADDLVAFHEGTAVAAPGSHFGSPAEIHAQARDNFPTLMQLLLEPQLQSQLGQLRTWTETQCERLAGEMEQRKRDGRVRECHGDLHLANLVLINGQIRMFDCVEFNEDLRWIDVASEWAFTYVDLLAHDQAGLATWFVNALMACSGDYAAARVLRFYAVYRALVRAKVAAIRSNQSDALHTEAKAYVELAFRLMAPPAARLVITHGLSGCGKTFASSELLLNDPGACTLRLRSDVERKRHGTTSSGPRYAPATRARTYLRLRELADMLLREGWSVIVDATFLKRADRDSFHALATQTGSAFRILAPRATEEQLRERIVMRQQNGLDASEATADVLEGQMRTVEPLQADEAAFLL